VELTSLTHVAFTCPEGHVSNYFLTQFPHEYLFESGLLALVDGYSREAVASIAASLERYYEFWLEVVSARHGVTALGFKTAWKSIAKQSERQLGGFVAAHLLHYQRPADLLEKQWVEFRNRVIHKGEMTSGVQATAYADAVATYIVRLNRDLTRSCADTIDQVIASHALENAKAMPGGTGGGSFGMFTCLGRLADVEPPVSVAAHLDDLRSRRLPGPEAIGDNPR
jgi:hypothetical protein